MAWEDQISLLSDEDKLKLGIQPSSPAQLPEQSFNLAQPSTFTPTQPASEELKAKLYEQHVQRMNGEGSDQEAIRKATEEAKPDLAQKLLQGLATFSTVAAGKQAPDYLKMNQDILEKKLAPIKEKQKSQSQAIDDAMKLYGLSREDAQLKLQQDKYDEDKKRYAAEAPTRAADLQAKLAQIKNMGMESGLKAQESKLKDLEIASKKAGANASDPNSAISGLYKIEAMKRGFKAEDVKNLSAAEIKPFIEQKLEEQKMISSAKSLPQKQFESLPEDKQVVIKKISQDNAGKLNVKSQIDSVVSQLKDPKISDNMKIILGRQMLKTLNSPMGADAVGAEEAKRLGGLLQWSNPIYSSDKGWFSPSPQIDKFTEQAELTSKSLGEGIASSDKLVEGYYKEAGIDKKPSPTIPTNKTANAGKVVNVGGKKFKVAEDGDTLIPME